MFLLNNIWIYLDAHYQKVFHTLKLPNTIEVHTVWHLLILSGYLKGILPICNLGDVAIVENVHHCFCAIRKHCYACAIL